MKHYINETFFFNDIINHRASLNETSVNRLIKWLTTTECGFITSFRNELKDIQNINKTYFGKNNEWKIGHKFTHEENRQKNKDLVSKLMIKGYGVIKVKGVYPEGMTEESTEESYLVFDNNNKGNLLHTLIELGEYYNQDSIYFKPKDSLTGCLIGTNAADFPGYNEEGSPSKFMASTASNYMSRLKNSAFAFVTDDAIKNDNKKDAMGEIEHEINTQGYANQHYWQDNDKTSFNGRKNQRIELNRKKEEEKNKLKLNNENVIYNLITICENKNITNLETLHPLTRKSVCEHYKKIIINESVNNAFKKLLKL